MSTGELAIRRDIGYSGITADEFAQQLRDLGEVDQITLYLSSDGGDVFDAMAMLAMLNRHAARKVVVIESLAASAASYLAMAGDELWINQHGFVMVHCAISGCLGNKFDMAKQIEVLDAIDKSISQIYASRTGGSREDWARLMQAETWLTAHELVDIGMAKMIASKGPHDHRQTAKASRGIASRSTETRAILNRLTVATPARPAPKDVRSALASYEMRVAQVMEDQREANRQAIVANARDSQTAKRYLAWS